MGASLRSTSWIVKGKPDVDLILTDPPYNVSHRNGREGTTVGRVPRKHITGERPDGSYSFREIRRDFGEWDYDFDPQLFLEYSYRMLRDGGSLIAFCSEFTLQGHRHRDSRAVL